MQKKRLTAKKDVLQILNFIIQKVKSIVNNKKNCNNLSFD
jgi:hypothetical protein